MNSNPNPLVVNAPISNLNQLIKLKKDIYNMLSKQYYLPKFHSKAITRSYLDQYSYHPISIFTMPREKFKDRVRRISLKKLCGALART